MARRVAALIGFLAVLALACALLWRVYVHHNHADPYDDEPTSLVRAEKITRDLS